MNLSTLIGDTPVFEVPLTWGGAAFVPGEDWTFIFTAKRNETDPDDAAVFQKASGAGLTVADSTATITLVSVDTAEEVPAALYYDIQAQHLEDGRVRTVATGRLDLQRDITRGATVSVTIYTENQYVPRGKSAYEVAVGNGFVGTEEEWLESLQGSSSGESGRIVKSTSFSAVNGISYSVTATATVTDPSPTEGKGFNVLVRSGTVTIGGAAYSTAGTIIERVYHSGAWASYQYKDAAHYQAVLVSGTNIKTVNDNSLLGSGNVSISAEITAGPVTATGGTSAIADGAIAQAKVSGLVTALSGKQATLTAYSTISSLSGYPSSFTPSSHPHVSADVTDAAEGGGGDANSGHIVLFSDGGTITSNALVVIQHGSEIVNYYAEFGAQEGSGDNHSFVARVNGAFGWFRGAYTGRIQSTGTLTGNRDWTLPDASGTLALVSQIPDISGKQDTITSSTALAVGSIDLTTALGITDGGTSATTAADARLNLDVQQTLQSGANIKTVAGQTLLGSTNVPALLTNPTGITGAAALTNIVSLTQAQYDAIGSKSSTTLYIIT